MISAPIVIGAISCVILLGTHLRMRYDTPQEAEAEGPGFYMALMDKF